MIIRVSTLIYYLSFFLHLSSIGQKYISTRELENIADKFGADSALQNIPLFVDITEIDTSASLYIALKCFNLKNSYLQLTYFSEVGQTIRNKAIVSNAVSTLKSYSFSLNDTTVHVEGIMVVPDQIFRVFVFQNDPAIIPKLKTEFEFWEHSADSIKNHYPSGIKRFFQRFKGEPPAEQAFEDCKENSYKLAWTLNKIGDIEFPVERVSAIQRQLAAYPKKYGMSSYDPKPYKFKSDTIDLNKSYNSVAEIDFNNEPAFIKLKENLEGQKCWTKIITNGKSGLYEIGCQWAPLAGHGKTIRVELIEKNKLKVTEVGGWIS